jgi:hypothetical protein
MQRKLVIIVLLTLLLVSILVVGSKVSPVSAAPVVDGVISPGEYDGGMAVQLTGQWDTNWTVDTYVWWDTEYLYVAANEPVPGPTTGRVSWIEVCMDAGPARAYLDCFCFFDDGTLQYCGYPKPSGGWGWYPSPFPWLAVTNTATEFQVKYTDYGVAFGDTIKMAIDRNLGPPPPYPLGKSAYWPGHEEIVFPTPDVAKWGDVTLDSAVEHVVDGTITPGEYDGGMAVQLLGPYPSGAPFPQWTTNAYIGWDTEYLYVAVNESVPLVGPNGALHSWIEFQFDAPGGYDPPAYHSFVLWDDRSLQYVHYPKPGGPWHWDGPIPSGTNGTALFPYQWWAVAGAATEFKVKYTDFGIAYGDTVKMSIDRGKDDFSYFPYGECAVWPNPCIFYPAADSATWGDVTLDNAPPPPPSDSHVVDGVISSGEYDGGLTVQLVGRWDPSWTATAYIDWNAQYIYVGVNESVPATSGHSSWIEFAIDAGPASSYLYAFVLFDDHIQAYDMYIKPSGPWVGQGSGNFSAVSNVATEFKVKYTDYGIAVGDTIKLSIDRNFGPAPPPPYGFAAFWPEAAVVYDGSPNKADPTTWGDVHLALHNIAITDITPFKTIIGLGYTGNLSVTNANSGDYAESLNTTVYANQTIIATFVNTTLGSGSFTTLTFTWDTTTASYGTYEISAASDTVPGETNTSDNNYTCPARVHVGVPGDVSSPTQGVYDGFVNMRDIYYIILLFNTDPSSANWKPNADINNDGIVNMRDIQIQILNFNIHE